MAKNIVCGIDIGNSTVKTIIAEIKENSERPQVLGTGISPSNGLRRGVVIDIVEAVKDLRASLTQAENGAGIKVKKAYVSVSGPHIKSQVSRGVIAVSRADNEISDFDIKRVLEAASTISLPPNREIIHTIPKKFIVDGQEFLKNPVGMTGIRLEADVIIIDALVPYLKSLAKVVNENGIEVADFVYTPLAAAKATLNKKFKEHGAVALDFGGGLCNLAVFEEGELIHTASLPVGSKNITNDLAIAVKTSLDNAEMIKIQHGFIGQGGIGSKKENIDLSELVGEEKYIVPKKLVGEVVSDRIEEITDMVTAELKKINRLNLLPGGVIVSGGGSKLQGFIEYLKEKLKLPAKKISSFEFEGIADRVEDPSFAVAAGLILWGKELEFEESNGRIFQNFDSKKTLKKLKDWFRIFSP